MTIRVFTTILLITVCFKFGNVDAQNKKSADSLILQLYNVLSGPRGARNWDLYKSLFHEKAVLGSASVDAQGIHIYRSFTPQEYTTRNDEFFKTHDFSVRETQSSTEQLGDIMHVFSTYDFQMDSAKPGRGINSFQLVYAQNRWWIISLQWTNERPDLPIPKIYGGDKVIGINKK
jgi:hypothetical protein